MSVNKTKYKILKHLLSLHIEKRHRKVYDKFYCQDYKITFKNKLFIFYYNTTVKIVPDFRPYLKYWKPRLIKNHENATSTFSQFFILKKLKKVNVIRYSDYPP